MTYHSLLVHLPLTDLKHFCFLHQICLVDLDHEIGTISLYILRATDKYYKILHNNYFKGTVSIIKDYTTVFNIQHKVIAGKTWPNSYIKRMGNNFLVKDVLRVF